jgi:hypothetical protein
MGTVTQSARYEEWADFQTERIVPEGPTVEGQTIYGTSREFGKPWDVTLHIEKINPGKHQEQFTVTLPLGIVDHVAITCTSVDAVSCRVQYG